MSAIAILPGTAVPVAEAESRIAVVEGIALPRLAVAPGQDPFGLLIAALQTPDSGL